MKGFLCGRLVGQKNGSICQIFNNCEFLAERVARQKIQKPTRVGILSIPISNDIFSSNFYQSNI